MMLQAFMLLLCHNHRYPFVYIVILSFSTLFLSVSAAWNAAFYQPISVSRSIHVFYPYPTCFGSFGFRYLCPMMDL